MRSSTAAIEENPPLLDLMLRDAASATGVYAPGPYWKAKAKLAADQIKLHGLSDFRGSSNAIGASYAGAADWDVRHRLALDARGKALRSLLQNRNLLGGLVPNYVARVFDGQVDSTRATWDELLAFKQHYLSRDPRVLELLAKYKIEDTTRGGCLDVVTFGDRPVAYRYLELLLTHDDLAQEVDFSACRSHFEIGGGFGANVHILALNYPSMRKFVYLDIPPNLYVGTQYLRSLFGSNVRDYYDLRSVERIRFSSTDDLEILCIAPQQIERLDLTVDHFHNGHSFVEMPPAVVRNYAEHVERLLQSEHSAITLVSYDKYDPSTTFSPEDLPGFFTRRFRRFERSTLRPERVDYHFISVG